MNSKQNSQQGAGQSPSPPHYAETVRVSGEIRVVGGPHMGTVFPLEIGETRIGRKAEQGCAVVLDQDKQVSGYHANIFLMPDGEIYYEDNSSYGSVVNGALINHEERVLHSDSVIEIGSSKLHIVVRNPPKRASSPSSPAYNHGPAVDRTSDGYTSPTTYTGSAFFREETEPNFDEAVAAMKVSFELGSGIDEGARIPIQYSTVTLGREDCDIILYDDSVSRLHATVVMQGRVFWLTDNTSTHGTYINGRRVNQSAQQLFDGDYIRFGARETTLIFRQS